MVSLLALLVLHLFSPSRLHGEQTILQQKQQSIENNLLTLLANCETLKGVLQKQTVDLETSAALLQQLRGQLADSAQQIADLEQQLTSSQESVATSAGAIAKLSVLLTQSQTSLAGLSQQFEVYKTEGDKKVLGLERQNLALKIIIGILAAATAGLGVWAIAK